MTSRKLFILSLCVLALAIPFGTALSRSLIGAASIAWLFSIKTFFPKIDRPTVIVCILFSLLYIANIIGLIHTDNMDTGLGRLESRLAYIVFPIIILFSDINKEDFRKIAYWFCLGVLGAVTYCGILSWMNYIQTPVEARSISQITYLTLLAPLDLHPTYISTFLSFCTLFIALDYYNSPEKQKLIWLRVAVIAYLILLNILTQSRAPLATFVLVALFLAIWFAFRSGQVKDKVRIAVGVSILVFVAILIGSTSWSYRFNLQLDRIPELVLQPDTEFAEHPSTQSTIYHVRSWYVTMELLNNKHFFYGYGSGDEKDILHAAYVKHGWGVMADERFNAHNEYMSALLRNGLLEMLVLLATLFVPLYLSIRHRHFVYVSFLLLWMGVFCFSTLNLQSALFFFTFFNALLARLLLNEIQAKRLSEI
jgi:hypothetical protein